MAMTEVTRLLLALGDRRPTGHYHTGAGVAWVKRYDDLADRAALPAEVFDRLPGGERVCWHTRGILELAIYPSSAAAQEALVAACRAQGEGGAS